jgi:hypothetical protein
MQRALACILLGLVVGTGCGEAVDGSDIVDTVASALETPPRLHEIDLHLVCSPWLYMTRVTSGLKRDFRNKRHDPSGATLEKWTNDACQEAQRGILSSVQSVFLVSGLPLSFVSTYELAPGGGSANVGARFHPGPLARPSLEPVNRSPLADLVATKMDQRFMVDTSTCSPFYVPPPNEINTSCDSTVPQRCGQLYCFNKAGGTVWRELSPYIDELRALPMTETLSSLVTSFPVTRRNRINVAVRYSEGTVDLKVVDGMSRGVFDLESQMLLDILSGTVERVPLTSAQFLPRLGYIALQVSSQKYTAAHEIGHVFGALHERADVLSGGPQFARFYELAGLANKYQFANTGSDPKYNTIMSSQTSAVLNFSTPELKVKVPVILCKVGGNCPTPDPTPIGDGLTDNRRYLLEVARFLAGDSTLIAVPSQLTPR